MNSQPKRTLIVWCNQQRVGELSEQNGLWRFDYAPEWEAFDLSPQLPLSAQSIVDGASKRPVQWFFDNLLPEEGARSLLAQSAHIDQADAFGLLAHYGAESAGALTLLRPDEHPEPGQLSTLSHFELSNRIHKLPRTPLSQGGSKRMSLAGAQHKLPVILEAGLLYEPSASMASSHILKPEHSEPEHYPHTAINEYVMMRLAKALGLNTPAVTLLHVPEPVYIVERFDRVGAPSEQQRVHIIDACQLLSLDRAYKYSQCTPTTLLRICGYCRAKGQTRQQLFQWSLFNLLIGNTDDHLKNLSFYTERNSVRLTPFYDLVSTALYEADNQWRLARLVWPVGSARTLGELTRDDILAFARAIHVPVRFALTQLDNMLEHLPTAWDRIYTEIESSQAADGLKKSGELHLLRQFRYGLLEDMIKQLTPV